MSPAAGCVRDGQLLMDFHSFPLRIMEVPDQPQEAILKVGFSDGIYGRSKGGMTFSGWTCEHLPYLVEIDNWGVSQQPGQARRAASGSGATTKSPGSPTRAKSIARTGCGTPGIGSGDRSQRLSADARQPHARSRRGQTLVLRQQSQPGRPEWVWRRSSHPRHLGGRRS